MPEAIELFAELLKGNKDLPSVADHIKNLMQGDRTLASSLSPILRAVYALHDQKVMDFCGHLRQVLSYYPGNLEISEEIYNDITPYRTPFHLILTHQDDRYFVNIDPVIMPDESDLTAEYRFIKRKASDTSIGDGPLYRWLEHKNYLTLSQKLLLFKINNMSKNETLLAIMPTGGGKSTSWELPGLSGSANGMIIVVVPTVALACDHEKTSLAHFANSFCAEKPRAYHSGLGIGEKSALLGKIREGQLPILYISPEALVSKQFKEAVYEAAENNLIGMLVIDEAHLITQWGGQFRPEFQLLPAFRNSIQEKSEYGVRTILLTATLNQAESKELRNLFHPVSPETAFTEFRADELRPELTYYYHSCNSEDERVELLHKLICQVPRPVIIYGGTKVQVHNYCELIRQWGFDNVTEFTGDTSGAERDEIIDRWRDNRVDLITATSAFGMGVDKTDVRTIISVYAPENISRFYQEVGRAGRDGYSSLSYWLPLEKDDLDIAFDLIKGSVPTEDLIANRWLAMAQGNNSNQTAGDLVWVDINSKPKWMAHEEAGAKNRNWNKTILTFMLRHGLIEIEDIDFQNADNYKLLVRLLKPSLLDHKEKIVDSQKENREREWKAVNGALNNVKSMMANTNDLCFSYHFVKEFPYSSQLCSGCPACRASEQEPYYTPAVIRLKTSVPGRLSEPELYNDDLLDEYLQNRNSIFLTLTEDLQDEHLNSLTARMIRKGAKILILPEAYNADTLLERIGRVNRSGYILLSLDEAELLEDEWLDGICTLFYSEDEEYNDRLYDLNKRILAHRRENKIIHIAYGNPYIPGRKKNLSQLVDAVMQEAQLD